MSYTTLSQQTGVSRTGISHHFPKKTDFTAALDGRIFKMFLLHLTLDSGLETFCESWRASLNNKEFLAILRLLFHHVVTSDNSQDFARNGIERIFILLQDLYGDESKKELECLIGQSIVVLAK
jgi:AcrR family transcriptional regulator